MRTEFDNFRNINKEKLLAMMEVNPSLLEIDIIIGSDLIFNNLGLLDFSNFLGVLKEVYLEKKLSVPFIYLAHKARNEQVDSKIPQMIEMRGYFGEQVEENDMDKDYMNRRIDIFILDYGLENAD